MTAAPRRPLLIGSDVYRGSTYGPKHPLAIQRVPNTLDLIRALGWLDPARYLDAPRATFAQLTRFHTPAYVAALQRAEATQAATAEDRERHHIGAHGNPVFREIFRRPATGAGGAILAARLTVTGGTVHVPGAGTHHALRDRASGFCYVNDVVLGLLEWLDLGLTNILYIDLDAHHGDGVEIAFHDDPRVFTVSIHEAGRWPHTGHLGDRAGGHARNIPVPPGYNDTEAAHVLGHALLPFIRHLRPQAVMLQCGADSLEEDPLARLSLSNHAYLATLRAVMAQTPRLIVTGGGGYNPWSVARLWAAIWGTLDGRDMPERLPAAAEAVLRVITWDRAAGRNPPEPWFTTLLDAPRPGPVRDEIAAACEEVLRDLPEPVRPAATG
ncbi:acetoin utilization protein AcuC [Roseomonas sp. CCTCC AB2023176]|uniref:acetoin utilization protein AcuC n=1 Tax=Roseomonas sp. CCTCC AB2023176 TaxID=3342640 RepID=UPI0035D91F61